MEIWKDIIGFEGYYKISDLGRCKSVERDFIRSNGFKMIVKERILSGYITKNGYILQDLYIKWKRTKISSHRAVMQSFKYNSELDINHINGIKTDNRLENLEYCTRSENMLHAFRSGLCEKTRHNSKLGLNGSKTIVLNLENGVFNDSIKEASICYERNQYTLTNWLVSKMYMKNNKSNLIAV